MANTTPDEPGPTKTGWAAGPPGMPANGDKVPSGFPPGGVTPAGWYGDPCDHAHVRYWDGEGWAEAEPRVAPSKGWYRDPYGIARYRFWTGNGWGQATRRRLPWLRAFGIALGAVPTLLVLMVMVGVIFLPEEGDLGNGNPTMHAIGSVIMPVLGVAFFCALVALPASLVAWGVETIRLHRLSPPPRRRHDAHNDRST